MVGGGRRRACATPIRRQETEDGAGNQNTPKSEQDTGSTWTPIVRLLTTGFLRALSCMGNQGAAIAGRTWTSARRN